MRLRLRQRRQRQPGTYLLTYLREMPAYINLTLTSSPIDDVIVIVNLYSATWRDTQQKRRL